MDNVFGLDIGTRNVVGTVGYRTEDESFVVVAQNIRQHETRSMLDGQIHDIGRVARTIASVKAELESQTGEPLSEVCIAAAGRVLKTVTTHVEYEYAEETVVTGEDIHTLNLLGIEQAQNVLMEQNDTNYKFYCVGYSVVKYYLNDEVFISIESHKANKIGEDIIVTFLPEDVVDGLYSAVGQAGLTVANMTLEPIAAINVAIPENFRMLNLALVDVGAGTSDISVTKEGSIIAYGMIPYAGDELTEVIVQHYLVDFKTAEAMKVASTTQEEITYEDIMSISHTIPSNELWELVAPVVDKITTEVAGKIKELNGGKPVSACFVVGGGGKIHGFTEQLAKYLELPQERVALRGEEVLKEVVFEQTDIHKDPLLVTPIGICLNYYEQRNNFIMVRFNGERIKLYDNNHLTIVDAALQAGFPNDQLFPRRGMPINFTVNGSARIARGEAGEAAVVRMNGQLTNINAPLEPNCEITIEPSTEGEAAVYTIGQLYEYSSSTVTFNINGKSVSCPKFVEVNGCLEPPTYEIQEGDVIETRSFYTVEQVAEFMDVEVDTDREILVNNRPADFDTLVYENFSIEWSTVNYATAASTVSTASSGSSGVKSVPGARGATTPESAPGARGVATPESAPGARGTATPESAPGARGAATPEAVPGAKETADDNALGEGRASSDAEGWTKERVSWNAGGSGESRASSDAEGSTKERVSWNAGGSGEGRASSDAEGSTDGRGSGIAADRQMNPHTEDVFGAEWAGKKEPAGRSWDAAVPGNDDAPVPAEAPKALEEVPQHPTCTVIINGESVTMEGKDRYIFVDIFDWITFDLKAGEGKAIVTLVNGVDAAYSQQLFDGDRIELYWKEN